MAYNKKTKLSVKPSIILALMILIYFSYFSMYQLTRHNTHWTFHDLAGVEQSIWNTIQGRPLAYSLYPSTGKLITDFSNRITINLFGDHIQPIFLLLAIPYALFPRSETLLISMCLGMSLGSIPFYRITKRRVHKDSWALLITLGYLLLPAVQTANGWDPHGTSFVIPCILAAIDAAESDKPGWWWFWSILAMGTREDIPFVTGWAMVWIAPRKLRKQAMWMLGIGTLWSILNFFVIMPYYSQAPTPFLDFFTQSAERASINDLFHQVLDPIFWSSKSIRFVYYNLLLGLPFLFLYFVIPKSYIASLPLLLINVLSSNDAMITPSYYHYSLPFLPYLLVGSLDGAEKLQTLLSAKFGQINWAIILRFSLLGSIIAIQVFEGYTPLNKSFVWPQSTGQELFANQLIQTIPRNAPASFDTHLAAQASQREILRVFTDSRDVDWIAINVWHGAYPYGLHPEFLTDLFQQDSWQTVVAEHGLILLKRGQGPPENIYQAFKVDNIRQNKKITLLFGNPSSGLKLTGIDIIPLPLDYVDFCTEWTRIGDIVALPQVGIFHEYTDVQQPNYIFAASYLPRIFQEADFNIRDCTTMEIPRKRSVFSVNIQVDNGDLPLPVIVVNEGAFEHQIKQNGNSVIVEINR